MYWQRNKPKQQQQLIPTTTTISNIKLSILKKEEYDIWAIEMEYYLEYIDNDVWKKSLEKGYDRTPHNSSPVAKPIAEVSTDDTITSSQSFPLAFSKTNPIISKEFLHPLTGDYNPKPQEEIDDSLYVYGKKGPQKPKISDSDDNSNEHSTCPTNDKNDLLEIPLRT
ncbi:hypothetical protein Tco_1300509 [Tanacetum coccineum]